MNSFPCFDSKYLEACFEDYLCVPGTCADWEGGSPSANLMEVKASETQGRRCEAGSEGSV